MPKDTASFRLAFVRTGRRGVCFWWMKQISVGRNRLMEQLREQGRRIERLSKIEHGLIKEVHPQVGESKQGLDEMIAAVKENAGGIVTAVRNNVGRGIPPAENKKPMRRHAPAAGRRRDIDESGRRRLPAKHAKAREWKPDKPSDHR